MFTDQTSQMIDIYCVSDDFVTMKYIFNLYFR